MPGLAHGSGSRAATNGSTSKGNLLGRAASSWSIEWHPGPHIRPRFQNPRSRVLVTQARDEQKRAPEPCRGYITPTSPIPSLISLFHPHRFQSCLNLAQRPRHSTPKQTQPSLNMPATDSLKTTLEAKGVTFHIRTGNTKWRCTLLEKGVHEKTKAERTNSTSSTSSIDTASH
ncbi:hypothetical protein BT67DRAFT_311963 [Trichocladium antarcticum]|uniref:Uncharacterized protein n=1 Tax=Trichocladium antarcticum TaxID=1450529 RepID=A0AAN6ZDW3_9PEZI|nr:hypothetical protein BT67DRAFT_311963 [Trichocladium antarcticum]